MKGSTHGRFTKKNKDGTVNPGVALKDLDWLESKRNVDLKKEDRDLVL